MMGRWVAKLPEFRVAMENARGKSGNKASKILTDMFNTKADYDTVLGIFCGESADKLEGIETLDELDEALYEIYEDADHKRIWLGP